MNEFDKINIESEDYWDLVVKPKSSLFEIPWADIWNYRDLLRMFVKRDIVTVYKQTILGPMWFVIQPIMTTLVYIVIFGNIAQISTDGLPKVLFYLSGIVIWNYFAESFNQTSTTFSQNAAIFGKVYFPRLIMPLSKVISALIKFIIQFGLFLAIYFYFLLSGNDQIHPNFNILLLPLYVIMMAGFGLGFGIIFTSLTTKYRDLNFLIVFGVQLLMYATPVIYPMSAVPGVYRSFLQINPIAPLVEGFRYALLGTGNFSWGGLGYSFGFLVVLIIAGVVIFNRTEKNFIDTV